MIYLAALGILLGLAIWWSLRQKQNPTSTRVRQPEQIPSGDTWQVSENGNLMRIIGNSRITVFGSSRSWKFCIANTDGEDDPYFSESYATQEAAMQEALAFINGKPASHVTNQQLRSQRKDEALPERLKRQLDNLAGVEKTLSFYQKQAKPDLEKLRSFKRRVEKDRSRMVLSAADFISSDRIALSQEDILAVITKLDEVLASIDRMLAAQSGGEA